MIIEDDHKWSYMIINDHNWRSFTRLLWQFNTLNHDCHQLRNWATYVQIHFESSKSNKLNSMQHANFRPFWLTSSPISFSDLQDEAICRKTLLLSRSCCDLAICRSSVEVAGEAAKKKQCLDLFRWYLGAIYSHRQFSSDSSIAWTSQQW
jgi:hypothetical protein